MNEYKVKDHESSLLPDGDWDLVWSDEFDGYELDRTKWDFRLSMMGRRHPAWVDDGVALDGKGNLVFTLIERDGKPVSAQLQTGYNFMDEPVEKTDFEGDKLQWNIGKLRESKFLHTHGYYECRCRLQQKSGWWSAFWIQSPIIGASLDSKYTGTEIDVMESFSPNYIYEHNTFTGGYGLDKVKVSSGETRSIDGKEFHRFGVLWDENGYVFYVDGVEEGRSDKSISNCPEFILISTEVLGYRGEKREARADAYDAIGDTFVVDYVRVFDKR